MREWIVTNGLGGYASLTHRCTTTRKFHGLLIASLQPPANRWVFVSNLYDYVTLDGSTTCLQDILPRYTFNRLPSLTYQLQDFRLTKTVCMDYGHNTTIIKYDIDTPYDTLISHQPLVTARHFYDCLPEYAFTVHQHHDKDNVAFVTNRSDRTLRIKIDNTTYTPIGTWEQLQYTTDRDRQDSWIDHTVRLGAFTTQVTRPTTYYATMTIEDHLTDNPGAVINQTLLRMDELVDHAQLPQAYDPLVLASDQFLVQKGTGISMVAGYPWFSDWGRDTLIALPGTTLVTKRYGMARDLLLGLASHCQDGLIPNVFMDRDSASAYNTVDASLWFIDRVFQYLKYTNDADTLLLLWPTMESILHHYTEGTKFGIGMDRDFLLAHGPGLTWMDVKIGEYYPTPRDRKAVEIQALWYNALRIMGLCAPLVEQEDKYSRLANRVYDSFHKQYTAQYDVIDHGDASRRPNKLFLVSLDFPLADTLLQESIVADAQENLVSLFGLQTLAKEDPRYKGTLIGPYNKDLAYHNGIVWPWLLGPFLSAFVKVYDYDASMRRYAQETFLEPMREIFGRNWDGTVPELFDAEPPFSPQGCITQAWSVAEILRASIEDIEGRRPSFEKALHEVRV